MQHPTPVTLSEIDQASLQTFIHAGKANARTFARAYALLKAADGWTDAQICETFNISSNTSIKVRRTYLEEGLEVVLHNKEAAALSPCVDWRAGGPFDRLLHAPLLSSATITGPCAYLQAKRSNWGLSRRSHRLNRCLSWFMG